MYQTLTARRIYIQKQFCLLIILRKQEKISAAELHLSFKKSLVWKKLEQISMGSTKCLALCEVHYLHLNKFLCLLKNSGEFGIFSKDTAFEKNFFDTQKNSFAKILFHVKD